MSDSNGNVTSSAIGGYSLQARLDDVISKLSKVHRRIKELEIMIGSCNSFEIVMADVNEPGDGSKSTQCIYPTSVFIVSEIPVEFTTQLNNNLDVEYRLRHCAQSIFDAIEEKKKRGIEEQDLNTHSVIWDICYRSHFS